MSARSQIRDYISSDLVYERRYRWRHEDGIKALIELLRDWGTKMQNDQLVIAVLKCVEYVVSTYPIQNKVWITIRLGSQGMGPNISVEFEGNRYEQAPFGGDITFWVHPHDESKFILIYSIFDPKSGEVDHRSVDLSKISEAEAYFDSAMAVFDLKPN